MIEAIYIATKIVNKIVKSKTLSKVVTKISQSEELKSLARTVAVSAFCWLFPAAAPYTSFWGRFR